VNCSGGITTVLRVYNSAGTQIYTDSTTGIASCSAIVVNLAAGTYYVQVEENGNNATIAGYVLEAKFYANGGSEAEPNETQVQSNAFSAETYMFGGHQLNADSDYFAVSVPEGASIRAELIEGSTSETCESNGMDSRLTLYNAAGTQLVDDDDDGRGYCSLIDGTGASPVTALDTGARALTAGIYYIQVRASTFATSGAGGQFDYRLAVTVR
jgi:hypothetical protein